MTEDEKAMYEIVRRDPCTYCGIPDDHWRSGVGADHIVPLSQGGETASTNMTACCQFCNSSKHTKSMLLFLLEGGVRR
jgi:5-methylcytosine-specific restriction endonuclease McrA